MKAKTEEELSHLRVKAARKKVKSGFSYFKLSDKKAVSQINPDPLSKEDRKRIEDIKDNRLYGEEVDLW